MYYNNLQIIKSSGAVFEHDDVIWKHTRIFKRKTEVFGAIFREKWGVIE